MSFEGGGSVGEIKGLRACGIDDPFFGIMFHGARIKALKGFGSVIDEDIHKGVIVEA